MRLPEGAAPQPPAGACARGQPPASTPAVSTTVLGHLQLPHVLRLWGVDSGVTHHVAGDAYGRVRAAAFMGRTILRQKIATRLAGLEAEGKVAADTEGASGGMDVSESCGGFRSF